jgi:hypothetical protein
VARDVSTSTTSFRWTSVTTLDSAKDDGLSNTFLIGEKHVPQSHFGISWDNKGDGSIYNGDWPESFTRAAGSGYALARSANDVYNRNFGSYHQGVCQFVMADRSVRSLRTTTPTLVLERLAMRNDGQPVPNFD